MPSFKFPSRSAIRSFLLWYVLGLGAIGFVLLVFLASFPDIGSHEVWYFWSRSVKFLVKQPLTYLVAVLPFGISLLVRSWIRDYKHRSWSGLGKGILYRAITPLIAVWLILQFLDLYRLGEVFDYSWDHAIENPGKRVRDLYQADQKQRGIHAFGLAWDSLDLQLLTRQNIEWITLVPYLSQPDAVSPFYPPRRRTDSLSNPYPDWTRVVDMARAKGMRLMLKPHIWLSDGSKGWRGEIQMKDEEDWALWFERYSDKMLSYARFAEREKVELLCIGTELHSTITAQAARWRQLVREIKRVYSGELTYAANWSDNLEEIPFWDELDYIGVQAYFPLTKRSNPTLEMLEKGWRPHLEYLRSRHEQFGKPILFTEIGYRSAPNAGKIPWEWYQTEDRFFKPVSHRTQALCYQAFFNTIWDQPWFAGAHVWEWQARGKSDGQNTTFTVEGKPALNVLAKGFGPK